jgi:hypothetical protein
MAKEPSIAARFSSNKKRLVYVSITAVIVLIPIVYFYVTVLNQPSLPRAAIIDQLGSAKLAQSIRFENQSFVATTLAFLQSRFSIVDYYSDNATVEEYKELGSRNYKLIVWRAHSALDQGSKYVAISTTETYGSQNYDAYLDNDQLTLCNITGESDLNKMYLGITPKFVKEVINGRFEDTAIILMSCNGLRNGYYSTARAFEEKGARVFVSWDEWVDFDINDHAGSLLLQYLFSKNDTLGIAIGRIPAYSSGSGVQVRLKYDPEDAADYRVP